MEGSHGLWQGSMYFLEALKMINQEMGIGASRRVDPGPLRICEAKGS